MLFISGLIPRTMIVSLSLFYNVVFSSFFPSNFNLKNLKLNRFVKKKMNFLLKNNRLNESIGDRDQNLGF